MPMYYLIIILPKTFIQIFCHYWAQFWIEQIKQSVTAQVSGAIALAPKTLGEVMNQVFAILGSVPAMLLIFYDIETSKPCS